MIVTRFAPSPTGLLHLGHAYAAITAHDAGERFVLRIEDIDAARSREEFDAAIIEDLHWLGLNWEQPVMWQSHRAPAYRAALEKLVAAELLYPCFCTRKEIAGEISRAVEAPHGPDGPAYPGTCRHLTKDERLSRVEAGMSYALRLDVAKAAKRTGSLSFHEQGQGPHGESGLIAAYAEQFGDIVLARKEMPAAYHLAVVVDDAYQGVTLVTRGCDLFGATHVQRLLQALLGLPEPRYAHHRLILDANGKKFSKRDSAVTLKSLRAAGTTPRSIRDQFGIASLTSR
jgi:glutamyl-Q tRNA(Asp) synthetase